MVCKNFKLLVWKNYKLQTHNRVQFVLSILMPVLFAIMVIFLRIEVAVQHQGSIKTYDPIDMSYWWRELTSLISKRHDAMVKEQSTFKSNVFIPQLKIGYAPNTSLGINNIMKTAIKEIEEVSLESFTSCSTLNRVMFVHNFIVGVCFHNSEDQRINGIYPKGLNFSIILPSEFRIYKDSFIGATWNTKSFYDRRRDLDSRAYQSDDGGPPGYIREGFTSIQYFISMAYFELASDQATSPGILMKRFNIFERSYDNMISGIKASITLPFLIGYLYPVCQLTMFIVHEREVNQRYLLNTNGIGNGFQLLAWFVNGLTIFLASSVLCIIILKINWDGDMAALEDCPWLLAFMFFFSYCFSAVAFCILISVICSKSKYAVALTPLIWFMGFVPFFNENQDKEDVLPTVVLILFLNMTFGVGLMRLLQFDRFPSDLSLLKALQGTIIVGDSPLSSLIAYFYIQTFIFLLMAIIIDIGVMHIFKHNVPSQIKEHWLGTSDKFKIKSQYKMGAQNVLVELDQVSLNYGDRYIIKNFSLQVHQNEIVSLVGQNASGKSTIMKLICGIMTPTSGKILIEGYNITQRPVRAYNNVGFSMHSVEIFEELTVSEQIMYFSSLRGLSVVEGNKDLKRYIHLMKWQIIENILTKCLTEGQRQVLELLCAFAGRSKIVLLGKPFDGVDLYHRKLFYKFLEEERTNRAILVTTSRPGRVEAISDRIAIIRDGELAFVGTLEFMHQNYSDGFRLIILRGENCKKSLLNKFCERYVPRIEVETVSSCKTIYRIAYEDADKLKDLLNQIPQNKINIYVNSYRVTDSTLGTMVYNIYAQARRTYNREQHQQNFYHANILEGVAQELQRIDEMKLTIHASQRLAGIRLFFSHVWTMLRKRFLLDERYPILPLVGNLFPALMALIVFTMPADTDTIKSWVPERVFDLEHYERNTITIFDNRATTPIMNRIAEVFTDASRDAGIDHLKVQTKHSETVMNYLLRKTKNSNILTDFRYTVAFTFEDNVITAWFNNFLIHSAPLSMNMALDAIAGALIDKDARILTTFSPMQYGTAHYGEPKRGIFKTDTIFAIVVSFSYCLVWALPLLYMAKRNFRSYNMVEKMAGMPFGRMAFATLIYEFLNVIVSLVPLNAVVLFFHFNKQMHAENFFVFTSTMLTTALCVISLNILIMEVFQDARNSYVLFLVFHSFCIIYFVAAFELDEIRKPEDGSQLSRLSYIPFYSMTCSFVHLFQAADFIHLCNDREIESISTNLENCKLTPNCCFNYSDNYYDSIIPMLIVMVLSWIIYFLYKQIVFRQHISIRRKVRKDNNIDSYYDQYVRHFMKLDKRDESWIGEKIRVRTVERGRLRNKPLHCENVGVQLGNRAILSRLNFMIERYQTFAVLGMNGAGKSVLMESILGLRHLNNGTINIDFSDNAYDIRKIYKSVGYCSQSETLLEGLTTLETIEFMLHIRGLPRTEVQKIGSIICKAFGFYRFRFHTLDTCSHSIVKRVGIAIAMIGYASLILLDDPFTCLDESGQNRIMHIIGQVCARGQSVMITSVDPDDCELVHRIALLKDSMFSAVGELHKHLLSEYYEDYVLVILSFRMNQLEVLAKRNPKEYTRNEDSRQHLKNLNEIILEMPRNRKLESKFLLMSSFIENTFPMALIKDISFKEVTCWFSNVEASYADIFQQLYMHAGDLYTFSMSQVTLDTLFVDYAQRPDRMPEVMRSFKY